MAPAGRPIIGAAVNVRLGDELLDRVDSYAAQHAISRSKAIRQLVAIALGCPTCAGEGYPSNGGVAYMHSTDCAGY